MAAKQGTDIARARMDHHIRTLQTMDRRLRVAVAFGVYDRDFDATAATGKVKKSIILDPFGYWYQRNNVARQLNTLAGREVAPERRLQDYRGQQPKETPLAGRIYFTAMDGTKAASLY